MGYSPCEFESRLRHHRNDLQHKGLCLKGINPFCISHMVDPYKRALKIDEKALGPDHPLPANAHIKPRSLDVSTKFGT